MIAGTLTEAAERVRLFRAPWPEVGRRRCGLPRGAWGMTLAHIGLGVFVLGAAFETAWRVEAAEVLRLGQTHARSPATSCASTRSARRSAPTTTPSGR